MDVSRDSRRIQRQKGLDLITFQARLGTEEQCREALFRHRWPQGFRCPACQAVHCWKLARPLLKCTGCGRETSLTAGTLFHSTKLPLSTWFLGIYLLTQTKTGMSALEMKRHLGVNIKTASLLQHKLMEALRRHESGTRLKGIVELESGTIGIRHGSPSAGKRPGPRLSCLMAIQKTARAGVHRICIDPVPSFRKEVLKNWAAHRLDGNTQVLVRQTKVSCGIEAAGFPLKRVLPNPPRTGRAVPFHWTTILRHNLVSALRGVRHLANTEYQARYLALFQFRLNNRYDLSRIQDEAIRVAAQAVPAPRPQLMGVENHGHSLKRPFPWQPPTPPGHFDWQPT
jgi:transposase-like protein